VLDERMKLLVRHRCVPNQTRLQALPLCRRQGVEIDAMNALLGTRALQPTQENLGGTRIRDCALPQTTFDFCVTGGFAVTPGCAPAKAIFESIEREQGLRGSL
jgi:hypothetical protein